MNGLKIWFLKKKARRQYLRYQHLLSQWSCGSSLAEYISIEVTNARLALNETLGRLEALGENLHEA
ncbi:hypothetical protein LCGC14_1233550 [marine sediment metagenome]|uniref:Uncharacterized protein n=1 Tax=marine sediment metagenome TaxID=412755 RepID=A0A0F9NQ00_9ZZZZ